MTRRLKTEKKQNPLIIIVYLGMALIGIIWWFSNLGHQPAYGDTAEFWRLARTLEIDSWRTLAYPLALRVALGIGKIISPRVFIYLLQTIAAFCANLYMFTTLDRAVGNIKEGIGRRLFLSVVLLTTPQVAHFSLTILADSFATSFLIIGLCGVTRLFI